MDARTRRTRWVIDVGAYPDTLALDRGSLWIGLASAGGGAGDGSIARVSSTTGRRLGTIRAGNGQPLRLAGGGPTVWLVNAGDQRVWRIDASTGAVEGATVIAPGVWDSATVAADAHGAWVAYYRFSADVSVLVHLDARGRIDARRRFSGTNIEALAIDRSMLLAAGARTRTGALLRLDARTGTPRAAGVSVGRSPIALALTARGVWVSSLGERRALRRVDVGTGRIAAGPYRAPGRSARADDLAVAGGFLWAINAYGIASQISPLTGAVVGRVGIP